jgi:hypothetical protein
MDKFFLLVLTISIFVLAYGMHLLVSAKLTATAIGP